MNIEAKNLKLFVGLDHIWRQSRTKSQFSELKPILFLDRDGVIVDEVNYLHRISDVKFIAGVAETVVIARQAGWRIAMITNQAGIGRGYYSWDEFAIVNQFILECLDSQGAIIDAVLATPHHSEGINAYKHPNHIMRKPNPGMLLETAEMLKGDLNNSLIVGDNVTDLLAGQRANLKQGFHVLTGHGTNYQVESESLMTSDFNVQVISDISDKRLRQVFKT